MPAIDQPAAPFDTPFDMSAQSSERQVWHVASSFVDVVGDALGSRHNDRFE
jgi:hypothetical protein